MMTKNKNKKCDESTQTNTEEWEKQPMWPEKFCISAVWLIFGCILIFLSVISMLLTCSVYGSKEVIRYGADQPILHLLFFLAIIAAGVVFRKNGFYPWKFFAQTEVYSKLLFIAMGICAIWILFTGFWPSSDQRLVFESAQAFLMGDYSPWAPEGYRYSRDLGVLGYAYTYPSQNGLILFFAAIAFVFRDMTPYVLQFLNIFFLFAGNIFIGRLFRELLGEKSMKGTELLMIAFLPLTFYITFVYGTIPGFACSSAAMYYEYRFLKTGRWRLLFSSAFLICGATILKSNYLIVLVAMVIYLLTCSLFRKKLRFFWAAALMLFLYMGSGRAVNLYLETTIGVPIEDGIPMLAWVEMGLQEGSRAPGWYNGYNVRVFSQNESHPAATLAAVKEDFKETLQEFAENPREAGEFFIKKAASIWAEPTFQSLWIQEIKGDSWLTPGFTESLFDKGGILNRIYVAFYDYAQTLVYVGALLFLILRRKSITWPQLMPAVIFIGGFLFHMVWEAKGQYSVCYFMMLIPYAVIGLKELVIKIHN